MRRDVGSTKAVQGDAGDSREMGVDRSSVKGRKDETGLVTRVRERT